jgi:hypothetical protein
MAALQEPVLASPGPEVWSLSATLYQRATAYIRPKWVTPTQYARDMVANPTPVLWVSSTSPPHDQAL